MAMYEGDILVGQESGIVGTIMKVVGTSYYIKSEGSFIEGENVDNLTQSSVGTIGTIEPTYSLFGHERGHDAIVGENTLAINSHFTTLDFGLPTGQIDPNAHEGVNNWTRLTRIEPDFVQTGDMSVQVVSLEYAKSEPVTTEPYIFSPTTEKIDMRVQARHIRLKFNSNVAGGNYEMGSTLMHTEVGDDRT